MILLLFLLQIQDVFMGFTSCEVNPDHPEIIYPSNSNSFLQPIDKYFHGQGLNYSINGTYQFGVSQTTKMSKQTLKSAQFDENTIFIDDAAYFNWSNPNYQQDQFVALVSTNNEYFVYEVQSNTKTPTWSKLTPSFSSTQTAICTNVAYVFDNDIIVSCVTRKEGFQIFFFFQRVVITIFKIAVTKYLPVLIQSPYEYVLANQLEFSYLQILNNQEKEFYAAVVHANYFNPETIVHIYKVEFQRSLHEPIKMTVYFSGHHNKAAYGAYLADPDKIYLLFFDSLVIHDFSKKIHRNVMMVLDQAQGMGVYRESYTNGEYNLFMTIVTKKGLDFYSTSNLQSNQKPSLPKGFDTNKRLSVKVSLLYSIISNDNGFVIYENRYVLKEEKIQYGFLYYSQTPALLSIFNGFQSQFFVFQPLITYTYQIQMAYLYSLKTFSANYNVPTQISINAQSYDGTQCVCTFMYELLNVNDTYNFVALTKTEQKAEPILLFNSQSKLLPISDQFFGSNLQYKISITQKQQENDTIETLQPNATLLYINQVDIVGNNHVIAFTYTFQVDDDTFLVFTQLTTSFKKIQIEKCKFLACQISYVIEDDFSAAVVGISAYKTDLLIHIAIALQNQIFSYSYDYNRMEQILQVNRMITKIAKDIPPTINIQSVNYVQEALIILTNTPNSIICVDKLLIHQYTISGNLFSPRQVFMNPYIFNDTYFVDNQFELLMIQNSKNNFDIKEETQKRYQYNIFVKFNYPNNYQQQQINLGLVREGIYLIQISQTGNITTQNIYFYPYQFLYYGPVYKQSAQYQIVSLSQFQVSIQYPFVTGISNNDKYYVTVKTNTGNQYQLFVLNPSITEYSQIYQIINLEQLPTNLNIISINRGHNQLHDKELEFNYDLLFLTSSTSNTIQQIQLFKEANILYTPNIQQNRVDQFELQVIAYNNFNQTLPQATKITRQIKSTKQEIGIIERENQAFSPISTYGAIFYLNINPADYFFGYISNYTAINKIGIRKDLNEGFIDCYQRDKKHQVINNSVVQPITRQQANFSLVYTSVTSGIISGQDTVQTFIQSGRAMYILYDMEALFLYTVPAYIDATCIFSFITSDTGYLITVCSNQDDTYFYYYNGTDSDNRTVLGFSAYTLLKQEQGYPNLISAQFQYNTLALQYSKFILTVNVSASNATLQLLNLTQYNFVYPLKSYSLFIVDTEDLEMQNSKRNKTIFNKETILKFLAKMDAGVIVLYENSVLQFQYKTIAKFGAYQSSLPNGLQILGVTSISIGWITNTYLSTPFLISTTTSSYLFQVTLPIIERSGSATVDFIYKLISFAKYKTLGVYSGGDAIVGFFYTESNELGDPEYVFGLYGIPTLKDFTQDLTLKVAFNPNKVYQHVGSPVGFIGIQNLTKYNISNPIITNNQTILYQVNETEFQYLYVTNQIKITVNQVECINNSTINDAINITQIELVAINNFTSDFSRNSFFINNYYPDYTFWVTENRRRNFWWQFGVGAIFFFIIIGVLIVLCINSNKIIVYQERILQNELEQ